jgi:flagellar motor switch protein FliG
MPDSQLRNAAVLLLSLPEEEAALLLGRLEPAQIEAVAVAMTRVGSVVESERDCVLRRFVDARPGAGSGLLDGLDTARRLVQQALGDSADAVLAGVQQRLEQVPFGFLAQVDHRMLCAAVRNELPQTIAIILAHLPARRAAEVIQTLPPDLQPDVLRRIATSCAVGYDVVSDVERGLADEIDRLTHGEQGPRILSASPAIERQGAPWPLPLAS